MTTKETVHGTIEISPTAIATLVSHTLKQTYGVVGMATAGRASDIAAAITRDPHRGVDIRIEENVIEIELYVVLEYGTRIASVATSIINSIRYTVEKHSGLPVKSVAVHVQGLRISTPTEK